MKAETIGTLLIAAVAVLGSIGSVLMLSFRVGKLSGEIGARMSGSEADRARLWQSIGALTDKMDRHIERHSPRHDNRLSRLADATSQRGPHSGNRRTVAEP